MPQPPFKVDALQIESGSGDTLIIERDSTSGDLKFTDKNHVGLLLSSFLGLRAIPNLFLVGKSGEGAEYKNIQAAVDAVPSDSSSDNPHVILVAAGVYDEIIEVTKDGISIISLGESTLKTSTLGDTLTVKQSVTTTPKYFYLKGFEIQNDHPGKSCIKIEGVAGSSLGEKAFWLVDNDLISDSVGGFCLHSSLANIVNVEGGSWSGSVTSSSKIDQCHRLKLERVDVSIGLGVSFDSTLPTASLVSSSYIIKNCIMGDILSELEGGGELRVSDCQIGPLIFSGDQNGEIRNTKCDNIIVNGGQINFIYSTRGTLSGIGIFNESYKTGEINFVASSSESVVFSSPQEDDKYQVSFDTNIDALIRTPTKTGSGFTLSAGAPQTGTLRWSVSRNF